VVLSQPRILVKFNLYSRIILGFSLYGRNRVIVIAESLRASVKESFRYNNF
jgi:hypothetical protein